ncbi:transglycosylase SLT domain-containing protein [Palleronia sp. LCG004]|uniref:transglycosylase SLT domain-containing protein n=1 Tax=Palleronia sp. LCG004 TaxID=3079304 RepID=UPI002941F275|nr:transglycosylase SLT domain-containing protein [Palleronia sp. LCG004]WOI55297.1 ABC transporter permease [Palleronia sp. LCG004]
MRPESRPAADPIPATRWDHRSEGDDWTRAALRALKDHGSPLVDLTPRDIGRWCPGYDGAPDHARRAFWVGFLSTLAEYESRWRPGAVGGGGRWFGLVQIAPATADGYRCEARSGGALKDGGKNLACAIRIMATTVPRDGVIHSSGPDWGGVSADWGPMRSASKRADMREWLRGQEYCQLFSSPRPEARPELAQEARDDRSNAKAVRIAARSPR